MAFRASVGAGHANASMMSTRDMFSGEHGGSVQAGVGIFFQQESDGNVYIKTIVSGGSAERDGTCRVGDMIVSVDEREVLGQPLAALRSLILGVQGSTVRLGFRRREGLVSDGRFSSFAVELMRGSAEFFQSMVAQQSLEEEVETLRVQLRQALSHCAQDREELDRLRNLIAQERETADRMEKNALHAKERTEGEIKKLEQEIKVAEGAKRDIDAKLVPLEQSVADYEEEMMRGHEKERLRKEYIDELKKRHEEEKTRLEQLYTREQAGRRDDQVARLRTEGMLGRLQEELKRLRDFEVARRERDAQFKARFESDQKGLAEVVRYEASLQAMIQDNVGRSQAFGSDYFVAGQAIEENHHQADVSLQQQDDNFFVA